MLFAPMLTLLLLQELPREVAVRSHPYVPPQSALSAETNLVESTLVVRNSRGVPLGGFKAADFQVLDNGKPEQIVTFIEVGAAAAAEKTPPTEAAAKTKPTATSSANLRLITLFFDDLNTDIGPLAQAVGAARKYLSTAPTGRFAIATSSGSANLDFTSDMAALNENLARVQSHIRPPTASCPALSPVEAYFYVKGIDADVKKQAISDAKLCICGPGADASCLNSKTTIMAAPSTAASAADSVWNHAELQSQSTVAAMADALQRLSLAPGSRTMVLLSTGFLPPLQRQLEAVVNGALRSGIVIHTLDVKGLDAEREGLNDGGFDKLHVGRTQMTRQSAFWEPLEKLADGTGGHFFHNNNNLAEQIEMAASPAVSYVLAFNPGARDGQFHKLKITANDKSYTLQFRPGYASPADAPKSSNRAALDAAVFAKLAPRDFPSNVSLSAGQIADGLLPVSVAVVVDMNSIPFKIENGRHYQQIVFLMTMLDAQGGFVTGKEAIMDLALSPEKLASLKKEGLKAVATLNVPPGIYRVRALVREGVEGKLSGSTVPVDLKAK